MWDLGNMKVNTVQMCPACHSKDISNVLTASDYLVSHESFDIMECNDCTLRFTFPIPDANEIYKYYQSEDYISHTGVGNNIINKIYNIIKYFTLRSKRRIVQLYSVQKTGSILDIGCGTGEFIKTMQQAGWKVSGVENNESARKLAEVNCSSSIMNQNEFFKSNQKYDVITLWHSLEHLLDLQKYLDNISASLNAKGLLIIAVPNYKSYDAEYYKQDWAAYDVPRHLYHFSFEAMIKLLEKFKFQLIKSKQLPFDPFYISLLSETKVKKKYNIIKALWIGWKSYWQGRKDAETGSSILYIFKKI